MKRKIFLIIIGLLLIVIFYFITHPSIIGGLLMVFKSGPPSPKSDVPLVYNLGWWSHQDNMTVDSIRCEVVYSNLNLFNSRSLFRYTIFGRLSNPKGSWKPFISQVHASERYLEAHHDERAEFDYNSSIPAGFLAEISLTPIVKVEEDKTYHGDTLTFRIKVEEIIESAGWGKAIYFIHCSDLRDTLELHQYK